MRKFVAMLLVACLVQACLGQGVTKVYHKLWGGALFDTFLASKVDSSGNVYVLGIAEPTANNDLIRIFKYGPTGNVIWSKDVPDSFGDANASVDLVGSVLIANVGVAAGLRIVRLDISNGNTIWTKDFGKSTVGGVDSAISGASYAVITVDNQGRRLTVVSTSNGALRYDVPIQDTFEGSPFLTAHPSGGFMTLVQDPGSGTVRRTDNLTGDVLWERSFPREGSSALSMRALRDGTIAMGLSSQANARCAILDANNGSTLREDPMPTGNVIVFPGVGGSYYAQADDFATRLQLRDLNGYLLGTVATQENFNGGTTDFSGKLILGAGRSNVSTSNFDLRVAREVDGFAAFFPLANSLKFGRVSSAATGTFFAVTGRTTVTGADEQGVLFLFRQALSTKPDTFAYRKGQVLKVGAPSFLANDCAWNGAQLAITRQPANGTLSVATDRSFTYTPNVGFFGADSFDYTVRSGTQFETQTVTLQPMGVFTVTTGGSDKIIGGNSRTGKVTMLTPNPFHTLVVQLTETVTGLAVTSSIQIPQGKAEAEFNIITVPVATDQVGTISAKLDNVTTTVPFTVKRAVPSTFVVNPTSLVAGLSFTGTVTMDGNAPSAGYVVNITHSGTEITTPISITVPSGINGANFTGTTTPRSTSVTHVVTVTSGGVSKAANLTLLPGGLFAFTITPTSVTGGVAANGKIQTAGVAPVGGTAVTMTKDGGNVSVPGTVTVAEGTQFKNFSMPTSTVTTTVVRTITATFGTVVKTGTLTITP